LLWFLVPKGELTLDPHDFYYYPELTQEENMNYPESTGPNDPNAPWNQTGWTQEQEELVFELKQVKEALDQLDEEYTQRQDTLYNKRTELREQIWNTGLDPDLLDDAVDVA